MTAPVTALAAWQQRRYRGSAVAPQDLWPGLASHAAAAASHIFLHFLSDRQVMAAHVCCYPCVASLFAGRP